MTRTVSFVSFHFAAMASSKSLLSRPLDLVFFGYFASHIPITALIDLQSLYPAEMVPQVLLDGLAWYVENFKDPFMGATTPIYWFQGLVFCEMFIQLPFFFIACYGLWKGKVGSVWALFGLSSLIL